MSLGAWMKDYVFYPFSLTKSVRTMGENAKKRFGKHIGRTLPIALGNILVFFLIGLWHGAKWNYIVWGLFYGVLIAISGLMKPLFDRLGEFLRIPVKSLGFQFFQITRTFAITCFAGIIFRSDSLSAFSEILSNCLQFSLPQNLGVELLGFGLSLMNWYVLVAGISILFAVELVQESIDVGKWFEQRTFVFRWCAYGVGATMILVLGMYGSGVDVNSFVYMQF